MLSAFEPERSPCSARPVTSARYSVASRCESEAFMADTLLCRRPMHLKGTETLIDFNTSYSSIQSIMQCGIEWTELYLVLVEQTDITWRSSLGLSCQELPKEPRYTRCRCYGPGQTNMGKHKVDKPILSSCSLPRQRRQCFPARVPEKPNY